MPFDVDGARKSGYTDAEIADHLAQQGGFDAAGARKSGYTDADIIGHLTGATPRPEPTPIDDRTGARLSHRFIIGSANDDATKLERARALYGDSAQPEADGRISFVNPDTGRRTYVNPSGFDVGDLFGSGREIASAAATLPFDASVVGIPAAAMVGAGVGEAADSLAAMLARYEAGKRGNTVPQVQGVGDAAKDAAVETALGTVSGGLFKVGGKAVEAVANPVRNSVTDAWRRIGLESAPSLGMAGEGRIAKGVEAGLSNTIIGGDVMDDATRKGRQAIASYLGRMGQDMAGGAVKDTPQSLGEYAMQVAAQQRDAWQAGADAAEQAMFAGFGARPASLDSTMRWIRDEASKMSPEAGHRYADSLSRIMRSELEDAAPVVNGAVQPSRLNVHTLRSLRTRIGQKLNDPNIATSGDVEQGALKHLYGKVTEDIEAALASDPKSLVSFRDFNTRYAKEKETRDALEKALFRYGQATPEEVGKMLMSPSLTPTTYQALEHVLGPQEIATIRGSIIAKLGRPRSSSGIPAGEVSPETLMTHIGPDDATHMDNALAPEVRQALFGGQMDDVRKVANAMRSAGREGNTSGTARNTAVVQGLLGGAGAAYGATQGDMADVAKYGGGAFLLPYALAKAHTARPFINALSRPQSAASRFILNDALPRAGVIGGLMSAPNE